MSEHVLVGRRFSSSSPQVARTSTVYHFQMELSDVDRGVYESLDFRVAQHPSEGPDRLVARVLAYALLYEEGLEFGRGLSDVEEPALLVRDLTGQLIHWIDVGTPSAERIHAASKKAQRVSIVCHKGESALTREMSKRHVHNAEEISVIYLGMSLVSELAHALERNAHWTLVHNEGEVSVTVGAHSFAVEALRAPLPR
jgi:uncharacterized protein YaeQ